MFKRLKKMVSFQDSRLKSLEVLTSSCEQALKNYWAVMKPVSLYCGLPFFLITLPPLLFFRGMIPSQMNEPLVVFLNILVWLFLVFLVPYFRFKTKNKICPRFYTFLTESLFEFVLAHIKVFLVVLMYLSLFVILGLCFTFLVPWTLSSVIHFSAMALFTNLSFSFGVLIMIFGVFAALYKSIQLQFAGEGVFFDPACKKGVSPLKSSSQTVRGLFILSSFHLIGRFLLIFTLSSGLSFFIKEPAVSVLWNFYIVNFVYLLKLEFFFDIKKRKNEEIVLRS